MGEYIIYTKWLAIELRKQGFKIVRTDVNPNFPQFDCWVFEDTEKFQKAFKEIANRK